MDKPGNLWGLHEVGDHTVLLWRGGLLDLYLQREGCDWLLATDYRDVDCENPGVEVVDSVPDHLSQSRWALGDDRSWLRFRAQPPSRPVLVRTRTPLKVPGGVDLKFYVFTPLDVGVGMACSETAKDSEWVALDPVPTMVLSDTWYGDQIKGEFCFSLKTHARRDISGMVPRPYRVITPVTLRNRSSSSMVCDRLCLRLAYANLFHDGRSVWSSAITIENHGKERDEEITYGNGPPPEVGDAVLLTAASRKVEQSFRDRALKSIR